MAYENVPAPTRFDDQILPFAAWVPIGKSNFVLYLHKKQKNPIFQISVDILHNTNFFRPFTASASLLAIYIQQFWNTLTYEAKTGAYSFQLDETRFVLDANLMRDALNITTIDQAHQIVSPLSGDAIMDFVNQLGYTEVIHFMSRMAVNNLYQPWRAILSMINQCLTGKTGHDRPRYPVLQMLWGIIMSTNVDYAELLWEEFVQAIQTFLTDKAYPVSPTKKGRKDKPHVILFCRYTKLIICHLGRIHDIHQRSTSPFHLAEEDLRLNLKFVPKGEFDEVFGMPIPNELISNNIRNAPYYNAYPELKSTKPAPAPNPKATKERLSKASTAKPPKPKPAKEKSTKTTPPQKADNGKIAKVRKVKSPFQLVDEPDEEPAQSEPEPELEHQGEGDEDDMELAIQMSLESFQAQSQAHVNGVAIQEPVAEALQPLPVVEGKAIEASSTGPSAQAQDDTSANIVCDSPSPADAETCVASKKTNSGGDTKILQIDEEQGKYVDEYVNLEEKTNELDQGQDGSDPDLEPTYDEFMTDLYPKVQESLKFLADEHVILEDPISSTRTLSLMKNLEDAYAIGDDRGLSALFLLKQAKREEKPKTISKTGVAKSYPNEA
nr:monodehydroascorbate reductase [Tanacetum cinerariifolium]